MDRVFITGFPRSGTSLLLRLLGDVTGRKAFHQPLPLLLSEIRRRFLRSMGRDRVQQAYPFADDQYENYVPPAAFHAFLATDSMTQDVVRQCLAAMRTFSGQRFKPDEVFASLEGWPGGEFASFVAQYFSTHAPQAGQGWVWKELSAEPLVGYLAQRGWHPFLIVRDPRDAIASMHFGTGIQHMGLPRPLLFLARQWRRSALYALARPNGLIPVRYETLLADPHAALQGMPGSQPILSNALRVRDNSSFPASGMRRALAERDRRFLEALCFSEMKALGYRPTITAHEIERVLADGPQPEVLHRPALERFLWSPTRFEEERDRHQRVLSSPRKFSPEAFLFVEPYPQLNYS